ncbi:nitroreductase/quinone reductase family protein [Streptomyces sp. NPDC057950]
MRENPLMSIERDGVYAVAAPNGAGPVPTWYGSVVTHPHVELRDEG